MQNAGKRKKRKKRKNLKTILLLCLIAISCSKDDEPEPEPFPEPNEIVGMWSPVIDWKVCATGTEFHYSLNKCIRQTRLTFRANIDPYVINSGPVSFERRLGIVGECDSVLAVEGTWTMNQQTLTVLFPGQAKQYYPIVNIFSDRLEIGRYTTEKFDLCDGDQTLVRSYNEYKRIN